MLHLINTSVDPSWQPITEYALGRMGWLMNIAFFLFGLSFLSLGMFFLSKESPFGLKTSGTFLLLAAVGTILSGIFNTDPAIRYPNK